jgi:hypothetical protein
MTIPKKGSRRIIVDNKVDRWMVTGNDMVIDFIVELEDIKGQKLLAGFDYHNEKDGKIIAQKRKITPKLINRLILYVLKLGWEPSVQGRADFKVDGEVLPILDE